MVELCSVAPDFKLPDTISDKEISLQQIKGDVATLVMFICNHCPFVKHVNGQLVSLADDYESKGISFVAISANDVETHPEDSPDKMKETANALKYPFPYLYDESQETAKSYKAACTPDFFIYDHELKLVYRGQLDDSRPGNEVPVTGRDIRNALDCLISDKPVTGQQLPAMGCNIKWKN